MRLDGGRFTLLLSATKLDVGDAKANWLSTEGRETGTIFFRFVLPEAEIEQPHAKVVDVAALRRRAQLSSFETALQELWPDTG